MTRKKKLEAGLEGLFSPSNQRPQQRTRRRKPAAAPTPPLENEPPAAAVETAEPVSAPPVELDKAEALPPPPETPAPGAGDGLVREISVEELEAAGADIYPTAAPPQSQPLAPRARTQREEVKAEETRHVVVFKLADEHYGLEIGVVNSIVKMQPITAVPRAPAFIEGVTNLRGIVLPVANLRRRFDMPEGEIGKESRIIVVERRNGLIGMLVDAVTEVRRVALSAIEPPSPLVAGAGRGVESTFITGIAKVDGRLIILLDLEKTLYEKETKL